MAEHWRSDGVEDIVPVGIQRGRDEIQAFFSATFAALPDAETTLTRVVAGDSSAAASGGSRDTSPARLSRASSRPASRSRFAGLDLIELEGGEIVSLTAYYDGASFARQVGMLRRRAPAPSAR